MSEYAYLTTRGRRTGRPHTIENWYVEFGGTVYLLSGGGERADWVNNLQQEPQVLIRFGGPREHRPDVPGTVAATARLVVDAAEQDLARRLVAAKYDHHLLDWVSDSLVVAVDVDYDAERDSDE